MERKELLFTDLGAAFAPKENLSPYGIKGKWRVVPYATNAFSGTMLSAIETVPEDVTLDPNATGWYRIYVTLYGSKLHAKLSSDSGFLRVNAPGPGIDEFLWRCADMTDEKITLTMRRGGGTTKLMAVRLVPMTEEEVAAFKAEDARCDTKRIYATDDIHNRYCSTAAGDSLEDWHPAVLQYLHSDVEWISFEQVRTFVTKRLPTENVDDFSFFRDCDRQVQTNFPRIDNEAVLSELVRVGHENGFKISLSLRMGAWGMAYPYDQFYFDTDFQCENPQWRCIDRNGDVINAMSYAYPEVQDFIIGEMVNLAKKGCDAVTLIGMRGVPYVLFEKPVADRFYEMYGEYPYELPLDEPRLHALHCEIMTEFMRKLRAALDEARGKDTVQIHLHTMFSVFDTQFIALDVERWAKEGLVNAVIPYPKRFFANYPEAIFKERNEGDPWRIDLDKYTDCVWNSTNRLYAMTADSLQFLEPYKNYDGRMYGPATQKERVEQWMALEKNYGVKVYMNIMPRHMSHEEFRDRAMELYDCGAERVSLWDTYGRVPNRDTWNTISGKLGHKDELASLPLHGDPYRKSYQIKKIGEMDVSRWYPNWGG